MQPAYGGPAARPPGGGFPAWAIAAIVAGVLLIGGAVAFILTRESEEPTPALPPTLVPDPIETTSGTPGTTGTGVLEAYLPPEVTNCRVVEPSADITNLGVPVLEAVNCDPPDPPLGGGVTAGFYLMPDAPSVSTAYQALLTRIGIQPDSGDCEATLGEGPAEQTWSGAGGQGRLLCRPTDSGSALIWTSDGYPVLGLMVSSNPVADVYVYWQMLSDYQPPIDV